MNWLETAFGISPDHGNGTAELAITLAIAVAIAMIVAGRTHLVRTRRVRRKTG